MKYKCENCGFMGNIEEFKDGKICPKCGYENNFIVIKEGEHEKNEETSDRYTEELESERCIFIENVKDFGFHEIVLTWFNLFAHPIKFFKEVPKYNSIYPVMLISLVIFWLSKSLLIFKIPLYPFFPNNPFLVNLSINTNVQEYLKEMSSPSFRIQIFLMLPIIYLISRYIYAISIHLAIKPFHRDMRPFNQTLRSIFYLDSFYLFSFIPYVNIIIQGIVKPIYFFIAMKYVHNIGYLKLFFIFLFWFIILLVSIIILILLAAIVIQGNFISLI